MGEELADEQLKDFCRRHGLAKDGYLDETELTTVCQCIGLQISRELIKELFEELDGDKDGRVCLSELSQMLRGMQDKIPPSPEKQINKVKGDVTNSPPARGVVKGSNGFSNIPVNERGAFSIVDPENTGFAKVGLILDLWSQLGISESDGSRLLSELGFSPNSKSHSVNLQDLAKSVEDEIDHSKERLPLAFQVALLTYRTEAQFLKTLCESIECERDKLRADIIDAHQRSTLIAQEMDEQNARLERNSQMLIRKIEMKYNEQIQDLQDRFSAEKDSLQQALNLAEGKLRELQEEDGKLKAQINKLNEENTTLEKELHTLTSEVQCVNRMRSHLEREVTRFVGLETQLQEMERKYVESLASSDSKLKETYAEIQALRDQNDELSMQLEGVRETLKLVQASQSKEKEKRSSFHKKRKGSLNTNSSGNQNHNLNSNHNNHSSALSSPSSLRSNHSSEVDHSEDHDHVPANKMGKYFSKAEEEQRSIEDAEECDSSSSLEHILLLPKTRIGNNNINLEHVSKIAGSCPMVQPPIAIRIAACIGESSTDPVYGNEDVDGEEMESEPSLTAIEERLLLGQNERDCASLESEMCAVVNSEQQTMTIFKTIMEDKEVQIGSNPTPLQDVMTQTEGDLDSGGGGGEVEQLKEKVSLLEKNLCDKEAAFEKEKSDLKAQCDELENSLSLLKEEYDKCEDYWHEKLQEARESYDHDRAAIDEKLQDLVLKIKEYEELVLPSSGGMFGGERLPVIEERASLERQVTDLEEECEVLRFELKSAKEEQDTAISNFQRNFEQKLKEECANLEQQVSALSKKCQEYESRLSALAEEERSTVEENGMVDLMKERIKHLELQLRSQDEKFRQQISLLESTLKEREALYKKSIPDITKSTSPQFGHNHWNNELITQSKSKSLLEMLHNSQKPESIWPQRFVDKSSSLPFIPAVDPSLALQPSAWGSLSPPYQTEHASSWGLPPCSSSASSSAPMPSMKKAWCHVELGWLQSLRAKLKQRDEQCYLLQRALHQKDSQTEKIVTELKYQHEMEITNWESLMQASQELLRQHVNKHKEQAEKLAHSDLLMKDLWVENAKLMASLNATQQRVLQLENLLKFQMSTTSSNNSHQNNHQSQHHNTNTPSPSSFLHTTHPNIHFNNLHNNNNSHNQGHGHYTSPSSPHGHHSNNNHGAQQQYAHGSLNYLHNNHNNNSTHQAISSAPLSLPHQSSHFNI